MQKYITRITQVSVLPPGEPIFSESCTRISIDDEAAGEFLKVEQDRDDENTEQSILIDEYEWPALKDAIDTMFGEIEQARSKSNDK